MCESSGQYLTVKNENFIKTPLAHKHHLTRKNRMASPELRMSSPRVSLNGSLLTLASDTSLEDVGPIRAASLYSLNRSQSSESLRKRYKSIDNLCFGRKKLHRQAYVQEIYRRRVNTDPGLGEELPLRTLKIPVLRIQEDETVEGSDNEEISVISSDIRSSTPIDRLPSPSSDVLGERKRSGSTGVLGSLLKQTLKVTSASMGLRAASLERLTSASFRPLNDDVKQHFSRSTSSVSTLAQQPLSSMAPLQTHTECQSVQCLNILDKDYKSLSSTNTIGTTTSSSSSPPQKIKNTLQHQLSIPESLHTTSGENTSARTIAYSETPLLTPQQTFNSSGSLRSISPLRRSASSNSSSTAKHEQSTASATAVAATTATTSNGFSSTTPPEKEKKRKEVSSSRVKKFHRHFSQVSKDEKLINYFSCALVSDILLQGYLYITDQHFAFYSNVFGYVTKVVIPTSSVTKITKEKTAKIIPNAVGVATADERHVFGSFLSREAAFRLMCSVCAPVGAAGEILPKDPPYPISGEYSIEDDSSCSISGNESPAQITELQNSNTSAVATPLSSDTSQTVMRRSVGSSNLSVTEISADKLKHSDNLTNAKIATNTTSCRSAAAPAPAVATNGHFVNGAGVHQLDLKSITKPVNEGDEKLTATAGCASNNTSASSTPTPSTSSLPTIIVSLPNSKIKQVFNIFKSVSKQLMVHIKFPTEIHVVYLGAILTLILALFSLFLLYRILDIEAKTNNYQSSTEFNWRSGLDDDILSEALRFQKQLQLKSTEEAQNILKTNLQQIAKVRRSLETLSMLIHDRSSSSLNSANTEDSD